MYLRPRFSLVVWLPVVLSGLAPGVVYPSHPDTEQDLLRRIEREQNPVKRAKLQVRLGTLELQQAVGFYRENRPEEGSQRLEAFVNWMKRAWQTLEGTGRAAEVKPQGFRDLDIGLRESARVLTDLAHSVSYEDRAPVDRAVQEVDQLRTKVLAALFPGGRLDAESNAKKPFEKDTSLPH